MKRKKGISLIVLVLTIVIIVILATAVILSIANNNLIENASEAKFLNDIKTIEEEVNMYALKKKLDDYNYEITDINLSGDTMSDELPSTTNYKEKIKIVNGKVVLKGNASKEEKSWAQKNNIQVQENTLKAVEDELIESSSFLGIGERSTITKVIFEDTMANAPTLTVDISETSDGSIIGWLDGTEVHIASEEEIYANEDSSWLFRYMRNLTEIENLALINTSNVNIMYGMFDDCSSLTKLDLSNFNTSNVTDMSDMFNNCSGLINLNLSGFDTSNVNDMGNMFNGCSSLVSIDLSKFETSNVKYMSNMFKKCSSLTELDLSSFNTSNVDSMRFMFNHCSSLIELDLSSFNTSNVGDMRAMFSNCSNLERIYASDKFTTDNVSSSLKTLFTNCINLQGEKGTVFDSNCIDITYARIDNPPDSPGYFSLKK